MSSSADDLINELLSRLPAPYEELPPTLSEVVEEAVLKAQDGQLEMIVGLIRSLREIESTLQSDAVAEASPYGLCSDAAAECLSKTDPSDPADVQVAAAERAIEIDPHAVHALVRLGDFANTREQRLVWYQRAATAAGHKDSNDVANLMPPLRNHMARRLIEDGGVVDAGQILLPAFEENPADPAACRYPFVDVCLRLGWQDELAKIVSQFHHDRLGPVDFAAALQAFALQGDSPDSRLLLNAAIRKHPGVAEFLTGVNPLPRVGAMISMQTEMQVNAAEFLMPGLREFEGAASWIRNALSEVTQTNDAEELCAEASDDESVSIDQVLRLPVSDEVWLYGLFRPPLWIDQGATPTRLYLQLLVDTELGLIMGQQVNQLPPAVSETEACIATAMGKPLSGAPRQASTVLVDPGMIDKQKSVEDSLVQHLDQRFANTQFFLGDQNVKTAFDAIIAELLLQQGPVQTALRDLEGINDATLAEFYQILAHFYRAKPWKMVGGDQFFKITCDTWAHPQWTACVMGQLGQEFGIALYEDPSAVARMLESTDPDFSDFDTLAVHFNEEFGTIPVDCWHRERQGWVIESPEAHPFVARFQGGSLCNATAEDIHVIMQLLPNVPRFLDHPRDQTFSVGDLPNMITLQWCSPSDGPH